jgi:hypothetical protein
MRTRREPARVITTVKAWLPPKNSPLYLFGTPTVRQRTYRLGGSAAIVAT